MPATLQTTPGALVHTEPTVTLGVAATAALTMAASATGEATFGISASTHLAPSFVDLVSLLSRVGVFHALRERSPHVLRQTYFRQTRPLRWPPFLRKPPLHTRRVPAGHLVLHLRFRLLPPRLLPHLMNRPRRFLQRAMAPTILRLRFLLAGVEPGPSRRGGAKNSAYGSYGSQSTSIGSSYRTVAPAAYFRRLRLVNARLRA